MKVNLNASYDGRTEELASLCKSVTDCHHSTPVWSEDGFIVVRNFNIKSGRLILDKPSFTDQKSFDERIARAKPEPGDIIITREAPMGEVCIIPEGIECCLGQRMVLIKPNPKKIDSQYLLYALQSEFVQKQIGASDKTGSIVSNLRIPVLKELLIPVFSNEKEKRIGKILSSLDSKIELNNKINAELEAMAKLIYDYWFVQFDFPISPASMGKPELAGKPYKSSGGPMVYNQVLKREIPEGWEVGELNDIAKITMGQSPPGESYNENGEGSVFYQGCTDFGARFPTVRKYTTQPTRYASSGDILLSVRAPVGAMNIATEDCCIGRGLAALNSKDNSEAYLYEVLKYFKQIFDRRNTDGTTFGAITKNDLFSLPVVIPKKGIINSFQEKIGSAYQKLNQLEKENQELSSLRDWLLPMLMNGQVTIKEAEEQLSMAAEAEITYNAK
ncbi:MAG: type I restriction enzyme S subunit [Roseivirga sp.]|jgi:type I restriction enzyme S subunit